MPDRKFRLVTRSDFDGLVCGAIFKELGLIDEVKFVHPKDMQDGLIEISGRDITTNLPYVDGVHLCFDHHLSETLRVTMRRSNHIIDPDAPSAARVVYNHYQGSKTLSRITPEMMAAVDKADAAQFSINEILNPDKWVLLNFLMDPRTGLGRFRDFRISNYDLMIALIDLVRSKGIDDILQNPDVKERADLYFEHQDLFRAMMQRNAKVTRNLVTVDLSRETVIYAGNRFVLYALFPYCNISITKMWGLKKEKMVLSVGKSILNRTSKTNIGELMLKYGGGGHRNAGTCQIETGRVAAVEKEIAEAILKDG
ncbi:MAG TPA: exopolyphosphatase [bacterium]|nr:exopolyphosphatase [bacterium]